MAAKYAWQVQQGMKLERADMFSMYQVVESVYFDDGLVQIQTNETTWVFQHDELVKFPRRPDGDKKIWGLEGEDVIVGEICIGDIIPPKEGWLSKGQPVEDVNDAIESGYIVTSVTYSALGRILTMKLIGSDLGYGTTVEMLVTWACEILYDRGTVESVDFKAKDNQPRKGANTSGYYRRIGGGNPIRFRIVGSSGRPPLDSILPPSSPEEWANWELLNGERKHPRDPR